MVCSLWFVVVSGQVPANKPLKIAVFASVYLDSVFTDGNYKPGNGNLPRYVVPGLDFYNGVMMAIDSLNKENLPVTVQFYDTKSVTTPLNTVLQSEELQDVSLIIAALVREQIQRL